ncbi:meiosis specific with OB domains hold'em [Augochlora pura]
MSGVYRQPLSLLQSGAQNALIIGIIINSSNMKTIDVSRSRFNCGERGVWTFTLRDSEDDTINVTVWGSVLFVRKLSSNFHIGSVVEVINPKVKERLPEDKNELFVPSVSSRYSLTVNEGNSLVQAHDAPTCPQYEALLTHPIKSLTLTQTLRSIFDNLEALRDNYVNVLVVVTFVSDIRNIITRDGRSMRFRNFEAADATTDQVASLVLWENDWIDRAAFWLPRHTVLFLTDARVAYDNFKKTIILSIARKTIIVENPNLPQTTTIRNSLQYCEPDVISGNTFASPNPDTISTVMTIQEISNKLNKNCKPGMRLQFAVILKAFVMDINVDSTSPTIITRKCALCKKIIIDDNDSCMDLECPSGNGTRVPMNIISLNLKVNLKDDTGYLIGCKLSGDVAERVLGCTATEFQAMKLSQREDLKWKYALEKCDIRLHILGPTATFPNAIYNILFISSNEDDENTQPLNELANWTDA